ncbi:hypothetical protein Ocin01_13101 [Orchesella cincta]|uniref:Uncharacterized protein n=1 Tax=Orchesella cincta TaxID=48709 RepID=A0A1D2ML72_ORCCI|nr:hypothetical protein Ocin01_13101 [Orchesella cincta]
MNSAVAPIIIPTPSCSVDETRKCGFRACFTRRHAVILIAVLEMMGSLAGMCVYGYATYVQPSMNYLVPIPQDLCNAKDIVRGVMFVFILLCSLEFFLAVYLLEAARASQINRLRFWLCAMLTYLALISVVIIGMEFGGIRSPTMNAAAFINIFVRFMEILIVYVYVEQETMKKRRLMKNSGRLMESSLTIASEIDVEDLPATPVNSRNDVAVVGVVEDEIPRHWRRA